VGGVDIANAGFEILGANAVWYNVRCLYRDKKVAGISVHTTAFFALWSTWNIPFYPLNHLYWSAAGAVWMWAAQVTWIVMAVHYGRKQKG
jgi:hypothetical protein